MIMSTPAGPAQGSKPEAPSKGARGKPRIVQQFPADAFQVKRPGTVAERSEYKRKREDRSDQQKAVDAMVWKVYEDWKEDGGPRKFVDIRIAVWPVPLNLEEDARHMLGKAAALFQRTLRYGDCPEIVVDGKKRVELSFYVVDRRTEVEGAPDAT
jgi:hypothetical protein